MKKLNLMATAILLVLALAFTAAAADYKNPQYINKGAKTQLQVHLQNVSRSFSAGTLILTGTDEAGSVVAQFSKQVYLRDGSSQSVAFDWQAPDYPTHLYWSAKVVANRSSHEDDHHDDDDHHD